VKSQIGTEYMKRDKIAFLKDLINEVFSSNWRWYIMHNSIQVQNEKEICQAEKQK